MTVYLNRIKGTYEEMNELFETANVRDFHAISYVGNDITNWKITIRCDEDFENNIKRKRTIKGLLKAYK